MANLQCHGKQVVVETGHSLDVDEVTYVSDVIVKIGETGPDGTTTYQINKLSLSKLKKVKSSRERERERKRVFEIFEMNALNMYLSPLKRDMALYQ